MRYLLPLLLLLMACNAEKKLSREQDKAMDLLMTTKSGQQKLKTAMAELYPCDNDTVSVVHMETDTSDMVLIFNQHNVIRSLEDSLEKALAQGASIKEAFEAMLNDVEFVTTEPIDTFIDGIWVSISRTGIKASALCETQVITNTVVDKREINRLNDSLFYYARALTGMAQQISGLHQKNADAVKLAKRARRNFIMLIAGVSLAIGLGGYFAYRKKLLKLPWKQLT